MFIDSDYNTKGFDGQWGDDIAPVNFANASGVLGEDAVKNVPLYSMVSAYDIKPSTSKFKAEGIDKCSGWLAMIKCNWVMKLSKYSSDNKVKSAFDKIAKTRNSYGYTMQEMSNKLSSAQAEVDLLVPINANMTCPEMDNAVAALNTAQVNWNASSVVHAYDRDLRAAYLSAIANSMTTISNYMNVRDCTGATSAIDTSQQAAAEAAAAAAAAEAAAQAAAVKAAQDAETADEKAKKNIQAIKDEKEAEIDLLNQTAALQKAETDKRNKMILFGAAIVIALLIIRK